MDANIEKYDCVSYSVDYKGTPFICRGEFNPTRDDWYFVLLEEDGAIFGCYCEFKDGIWIEGLGQVIYWQENM